MRFLVTTLAVIFTLGAVLFYSDIPIDKYQDLFTDRHTEESDIRVPDDEGIFESSVADSKMKSSEKVIEDNAEVITPGPLRKNDDVEKSALTKSGVIFWTNIQRAKNGSILLSENDVLNEIAKKKVEDMFENQYFAHVSPSGNDISTLAKDFGYSFIVIGENLALGNFENSESLVNAWMDSSGHRENILNDSFQEIGVAVGRGVIEGRTVWLAAQSFGTPTSVCPQIDRNLYEKISEETKEADILKSDLEMMYDDIKSSHTKYGKEYTEKINTYNYLVGEYNVLVKKLQVSAEKYNDQVDAFNSCAGSI